MEPTDKKSNDWIDWFIRHHFGATTAVRIECASQEELLILQKFIKAVIKQKGKVSNDLKK
jgi:hypothetical protein